MELVMLVRRRFEPGTLKTQRRPPPLMNIIPANHSVGSRPLKFAVVTANKGAGGSEELWIQAASELVKMGHSVVAVTLWPTHSHPRLNALQKAGIHHVTLANGDGRWRRALTRAFPKAFSVQAELRRLLAVYGPDFILFSSGTSLDGLSLLDVISRSSIPFGAVTHLVSPDHWPDDVTAAQMIRLFAGARRFWAVSRHNLELLETQLAFRFGNASIVRNPFLASGAPLPWRSVLDSVRFCMPGRLHPRTKGHDILIRVLAAQKWRDREWSLSIFGSGACENRLRALVELHGLCKKITFHGHTGDIQGMWRDHDALLVPSRHEGLPLTVVEAMWVGRVVIAQPAGGIQEVLDATGSGFLAAGIGEVFFDEVMERAWQQRDSWPAIAAAAARQIRTLIPEAPERIFAEELILLAADREPSVPSIVMPPAEG